MGNMSSKNTINDASYQGLKATSGAAHVRTTATDVPTPSQQWLESGDIIFSVATSPAYTSTDVSGYNVHMLDIDTLGATSVDVYANINGVAADRRAVRLVDMSTGAVFAANAITAVGLYMLEGKFENIEVDIVGTGATTFRMSHGVK